MKAKKQKMRFEKIGLAVLIVLFLIGNAEAVFINEFHYDNSGTDTGEAIEVAGPAGTDLGSWSIVFYNGGNGSEYGDIALTGVIPDQQGGYGVLSFDAEGGLQNGNDGLALYDGAAVLQFLSYEGPFTAVDGPADGMTSVDIGISESTSTDIGFSLQLTGSGNEYDDFIWSGPVANTFGNVNTGQDFVPSVPVPGAVWLLGTGLIGLVGIKRKRT